MLATAGLDKRTKRAAAGCSHGQSIKVLKIKNSSTAAGVAATTVQEHYTNTKIFQVLRENRTELQRDHLRLSRERRKRDKRDGQTDEPDERESEERERPSERRQL
jgi:hypothetical protein